MKVRNLSDGRRIDEDPPIEVAVTLSLGGNHAADTRGGAEQKMIPGKYIHCEDLLLEG